MSVFAINSCHLRRACRSFSRLLTTVVLVLLCLLLPKASIFLGDLFSWFSLFFLYFSERKSIKKENFKNRKPKEGKRRKLITPANSNSLLSPPPVLHPRNPGKPELGDNLTIHPGCPARTSPRLQCVTLIYAQELSLHILDHGCHKTRSTC